MYIYIYISPILFLYCCNAQSSFSIFCIIKVSGLSNEAFEVKTYKNDHIPLHHIGCIAQCNLSIFCIAQGNWVGSLIKSLKKELKCRTCRSAALLLRIHLVFGMDLNNLSQGG